MLLLPTFHAHLLPCSEPWTALTPAAQGHYCARCQRVVLDFSQPANPAADAEVIRVIKAMDGFTPGMSSGRPVAIPYTLPITFKKPQPPTP